MISPARGTGTVPATRPERKYGPGVLLRRLNALGLRHEGCWACTGHYTGDQPEAGEKR